MEIKEALEEILFAIYKIPGQFGLAALIALSIAQSSYSLTQVSFYLLSIFFLILEFSTPIIAGIEIYQRALENLENLLGHNP